MLAQDLRDRDIHPLRKQGMVFDHRSETIKGLGFGAKLGVTYDITPRLRAGAAWHSQTRLADLETEDGSFHPDNEGVHHFGFDREALIDMARYAAFRDPEVSTPSVLRKPHGDFPVFLITAIR